MPVRDNPTTQAGFASVAVTGTMWATGQMILNKVATVVATLVIARQLSQDEVGMAALAVMCVKFLAVLPPLTMSDVLISRGQHLDRFIRIASRTAVLAGGLVLCIVVALAPLIASFYSQYPRGLLWALLVVAAFRVLGDGAQIGPLTELRLDFRNRTIAIIDGTVQVSATALSVVLAVLGTGAWAMVVPVSAASIGKAIAYRVWRRKMLGPLRHREFRGAHGAASRCVVRREFTTAASAHYVHGVTDTLPVLMLGKVASEATTGLYAFGFNLAGQANAMIASQISSVLQPVLGRLGHDTDRQVAGYLRTLRSLGAVSVPICACQAVFGEAIFRVCFEPRWAPAAAIFSILSLCEAFFFASAPTMALLKAQGRFRTFLAWQGVHMLISVVVLAWAALYGGAAWVATVNFCLWACSLPLAAWLGIRPRGHSLWTVLRVFVAPWATAMPIGLAAWLLSGWLLSFGSWGALFALLVLAPATLFAMLWTTRWSQPSTFADLRPLAEALFARLARR